MQQLLQFKISNLEIAGVTVICRDLDAVIAVGGVICQVIGIVLIALRKKLVILVPQ